MARIIQGGGKARTDIRKILHELGYSPVNIGSNSKNKAFRNLQHVCRLFLLPFKIRKTDIVVWQFPYVYNFPKLFFWMMSLCKAGQVVMIHDLDYLRGGKDDGKAAYSLLQRALRIIVATTAMRDALKERIGNKPTMIVSEIFDYLTDTECQYKSNCSDTVVFGGNLYKSEFIKDLHKTAGNLKFYLYGSGNASCNTDKTEYMGVFNADDISDIKGDWGLVWDGDSIKTCNGEYGKYLQVCASHKNSLYLVCGKPLIVWNKSAMSDFVKNNGLGICVDSLDEISDRINSLTLEEKQTILHNVAEVSMKLRSGYYLKKSL